LNVCRLYGTSIVYACYHHTTGVLDFLIYVFTFVLVRMFMCALFVFFIILYFASMVLICSFTAHYIIRVASLTSVFGFFYRGYRRLSGRRRHCLRDLVLQWLNACNCRLSVLIITIEWALRSGHFPFTVTDGLCSFVQ